MFPIESLAFNGYLLYEGFKFKEDPSVKNARKVFKASLLYLPVFMGLMIFHKNGWSQDDSQQVDSITSSAFKPPSRTASNAAAPVDGEEQGVGGIERNLLKAKAAMKSICVHEYLTSPPLTRMQNRSQDGGNAQAAAAETAEAGFCPVTTAKGLVGMQ
jgi:hypothetical protein